VDTHVEIIRRFKKHHPANKIDAITDPQ